MDYEKQREAIRELVGEKPFQVKFVKRDKTLRTMKCRLTEAVDKDGVDRIIDGLLAVWEEGHKSIRLDSIIELKLTLKKEVTFQIPGTEAFRWSNMITNTPGLKPKDTGKQIPEGQWVPNGYFKTSIKINNLNDPVTINLWLGE